MKFPSAFRSCLVFAIIAMTGCASHHMETAQREQQAADSLRRAGASEAAQAAQQRADSATKAAKCQDLLECSLDAFGQLLLGVLGGSSK
jgi:hypothetical protein